VGAGGKKHGDSESSAACTTTGSTLVRTPDRTRLGVQPALDASGSAGEAGTVAWPLSLGVAAYSCITASMFAATLAAPLPLDAALPGTLQSTVRLGNTA
jgi:hypothetical protein